MNLKETDKCLIYWKSFGSPEHSYSYPPPLSRLAR